MILIRQIHIFLCISCVLLCGCVGIDIKSKNLKAVSFDNFQGFSTAADGSKYCCFDVRLKDNSSLVITKQSLISGWGEPSRILKGDFEDIWIYPDHKLTWSGLIVYAVIPVPLLVPTGAGEFHIHISGDIAKSIEVTSNSTLGFACSIWPIPDESHPEKSIGGFCRSGNDIYW